MERLPPTLLRLTFEVLEQLRPKLEGIPKPSRTWYEETTKRTEESSKPIEEISKRNEGSSKKTEELSKEIEALSKKAHAMS